jgi:Uma2 family endonuclease
MLMTPEEFDAVTDYDDRYRYALIKGVLVVTRLPRPAESDPNEDLGVILRVYQETHPNGGLDVTLPERYVYVPDGRRRADRVIWAGLGWLPDIDRDVPTIVADFVARSRRDRYRDYEEKSHHWDWLTTRSSRPPEIFMISANASGEISAWKRSFRTLIT